MASSDRGRFAPMSLALIAFIVTLAAVLYYGIFESPDYAAAGPVAAGVTPAEPREPLEVVIEAIASLRMEVAAAREEAAIARAEVALAREEAALAREQAALAHEQAAVTHEGAAALADRLAAVARGYEEMAARQATLEAGLAEARQQPPRIMLPEVVVQMAEPEVTFEPPPETGAPGGPQVNIEHGEAPRVRIERAPPAPDGRRE